MAHPRISLSVISVQKSAFPKSVFFTGTAASRHIIPGGGSMANTWVTDMTHYLDPDGELPDLPGPALNLAIHFGSIVSWMTSREHLDEIETSNVWCRRRPGRTRCLGEIEAWFDESTGSIRWQCPFCGDNGYISGWEGTLWDRGEASRHRSN